jgi:hypothetical protein
MHVALYVRDTAIFDVRQTPDTPPRLAWELPRHDNIFSAGQRATAAVQWTEWWRRLLTYVVNEATHSAIEADDDVAYRAQKMAMRHSEVFDPPYFESLADMTALQTAVRATFSEGLERYNEPSEQRSASFPWETVQNAAESTVRTRGIPSSHIRAVVHLLDVEGLWSYIAARGCALCSSSIAANRDAAYEFLTQVFSSIAS